MLRQQEAFNFKISKVPFGRPYINYVCNLLILCFEGKIVIKTYPALVIEISQDFAIICDQINLSSPCSSIYYTTF